MRVPWFSFTAIAALTAFAVANMQLRVAPHSTLSTPIAQSAAVQRKGGGNDASVATPPQALLAPAPPSSLAPPPSPSSLIIPVVGVTRDQLRDTWGQARSEGRTHEGIDILAPQGTAVVAAADGRIVKLFDSVRGGITIYEFDASQRFVYYYAHLLGRAPGLTEGAVVRQGQIIGFVGMTGNAPAPHLHFEVERLGPAKHWWQTEALNPYPYLMAGAAPSA